MGTPVFNPGSYTDIVSHPASSKLWAFLNSEPAKIKMKTASDLGRPALEGVSEDLLENFPEQFSGKWPLLDRFKQMAGAMTKQVMEAEGYEFVRNNVPMSGTPFSRASKYRSRTAFEYHAWRCSTNPRLIGITTEESAEKLSAQPNSEWIYWKSVKGTRGEGKLHLCIALGISDITAALAALQDQGAHIEQTSRILRAP